MMLCCLCCKSGPIIAKLRLDKIGYAPGEVIPIDAEITNRSRRKIAGITATLQMVCRDLCGLNHRLILLLHVLCEASYTGRTYHSGAPDLKSMLKFTR